MLQKEVRIWFSILRLIEILSLVHPLCWGMLSESQCRHRQEERSFFAQVSMNKSGKFPVCNRSEISKKDNKITTQYEYSLQRTKSRVLDWQDPFLIHKRERRRIIFIIGGIFQKSLVYRGILYSNQNSNKLFYWQM